MLKTIPAVLLLCFLVLPSFAVWTGHVQMTVQTTKVYIDPLQIADEALTTNKTFNITIKVDNIPADPGAIGVEFKLTWNSSVLNAVNMEEMMFHNITPESEWDNIWRLMHSVTAESVHYAYAFQSQERAATEGYGPISGSHAIARITFVVKALGKTAFHFQASKIGETVPMYEPPRSLPHQVADSFFSNTPPPPPARIYVNPPKISNVALTPCQNITISVVITDASSVKGLEFKLGFNASVLHANSITLGSLLPSSITPITEMDNLSGRIKFNVTLPTPLCGSGVLAEVIFHIEDLGTTSFNLHDSKLLDSFSQALPHTTCDGEFDNVFLTRLAIDPAEMIDPTLAPSDTFTVNVTIADARDLYGYEFNLTFDPHILTCLQLQIYDVSDETNYVPNHETDNANGFTYMNVTYYPPASPLDVNELTTVAAIKFRAKTLGVTNLTLTRTRLIDAHGQPMSHQVGNGYFQNLVVDIAITDLFVYPSTIYECQSTNMTITLMNQGNRIENFTLSIFWNSTLAASQNVTNLSPNSFVTLTVTWNACSVQCGRYKLSAQTSSLQYETDGADNILFDGMLTVKVPGDVDGDDIVDLDDALLAVATFGSVPDDIMWNPSADINGDNTVDIFDLIILSSHYGRRA